MTWSCTFTPMFHRARAVLAPLAPARRSPVRSMAAPDGADETNQPSLERSSAALAISPMPIKRNAVSGCGADRAVRDE